MRWPTTLAVALVAALLAVPAAPAPAGAEPHQTESVTRAARAPRLVVDLKKGKHRISPLIYGVNFADRGFANAREKGFGHLPRQCGIEYHDPR